MGASCGRVTSISSESVAGAKGNLLHLLQQAGQIGSGIERRRSPCRAPSGRRTADGRGKQPACSARRKASCTRLMLDPPQVLLLWLRTCNTRSNPDIITTAARQAVVQPSQASRLPAPHHEIVFKQRNAAENRHLGVRPHVLQVLERGVLHFARAGDHDAQQQPDAAPRSEITSGRLGSARSDRAGRPDPGSPASRPACGFPFPGRSGPSPVLLQLFVLSLADIPLAQQIVIFLLAHGDAFDARLRTA